MDIEEQYEKIYRYCYMKLRHRQTAEDLTQETFLRFYEDRRYREQGKRLAYLYTIARNLCTDYYRKKKEQPLSEEVSVRNQEEQILVSLSLSKAVQTLPQEDQELVFLRYVNEVPVGDISRILEISRYAAYRRLRHCLNQLKKEMRREDFQ